MVLKLIIYSVAIAYAAFSYIFFTEWLDFFLKDEEMNQMKQRFFYGVILMTATILWPIVVPLAYLELLRFHKRNRKVIDLLIDESHSKFSSD